jgi:hypothetical protein
MNHFNLKSLAFYSCAIGSVVTLFSLVSAHGEANLKAPQKIDGQFSIAATLPGCLANQAWTLLVQQSGIYLTGSLLSSDLPATAIEASKNRPALTGTWNNQQLQLSGALNQRSECQDQIQIEGTIDRETLNGTIRLSSVPETVKFTAKREALQPTAQEH